MKEQIKNNKIDYYDLWVLLNNIIEYKKMSSPLTLTKGEKQNAIR